MASNLGQVQRFFPSLRPWKQGRRSERRRCPCLSGSGVGGGSWQTVRAVWRCSEVGDAWLEDWEAAGLADGGGFLYKWRSASGFRNSYEEGEREREWGEYFRCYWFLRVTDWGRLGKQRPHGTKESRGDIYSRLKVMERQKLEKERLEMAQKRDKAE